MDIEYEVSRQERIRAGKPLKAPESCPNCQDERDCSQVAICRAVEGERQKREVR